MRVKNGTVDAGDVGEDVTSRGMVLASLRSRTRKGRIS